MKLKNSGKDYGLVSIAIHWLVAVTVISLFAVGWYMMQLGYYDSLYRILPTWHKSIGILLFATMLFRVFWKCYSPTPTHENSLTKVETKASSIVHGLIYILLFAIMVTGYLISTADGRPIAVFNWFEVPALIYDIDGQEDLAGKLHWYLAVTLMSLVGLHALGALKHHFIDKDHTLKKMLGIKRK